VTRVVGLDEPGVGGDQALVAGGELAPQAVVAGGVRPELDHQREPLPLALQQGHAPPGQELGVGRQRLVERRHLGHLGDDLVDALVQDGQEQVGDYGRSRVLTARRSSMAR
jgi:hypothetical protein